jgi:hypothetical protein
MMNLLATDTINLTTYADQINQQFYRAESHYVTLEERLRSVTESSSYFSAILADSIEEFVERNPQFKSWKDIRPNVQQAIDVPLGDIVIDTTLQRLLMFMWVIKILDDFDPFEVNPISVYQDPDIPGKYVCWDGQHTAVVLYIVVAMALGEDINKITVPVNIHPSTSKAKMRKVFMRKNDDGQLNIDLIDKFQQMVFGVRTDGATFPTWLVAEQKQQYLEQAKMFATNKKFSDENESGALTVMTQLMDTKNYTPQITQYFTKYFLGVCRSARPVQPKESWMLYEYFRLAEDDANIDVTDDYIRSVAKALKVVGVNDFDSYSLWSRARVACQRDWRKTHDDLLGIRYPEYPLGVTFLIAQIAKAGVAVPFYDKKMFNVDKDLLF